MKYDLIDQSAAQGARIDPVTRDKMAVTIPCWQVFAHQRAIKTPVKKNERDQCGRPKQNPTHFHAPLHRFIDEKSGESGDGKDIAPAAEAE